MMCPCIGCAEETNEMGTYLNPTNVGFKRIIASHYVDKSGLIAIVNRSINTTERLMCMSRPRRFGKSFAALMLAAYYSRGCDSRHLFEDLEIARDVTFERYLNQYHVILLDIAGFVANAKANRRPLCSVPSAIERAILSETQGLYPETRDTTCLTDCLIQLVKTTHTQIVFIIDEWDSPFREAVNDIAFQESYLSLLRSWFDNIDYTPIVVAAAFITGILPIKIDGSRSALPGFRAYTMLDPSYFARYTGFTEDEVRRLCLMSGGSLSKMGQWYDGYVVGDMHHVYNPYAVTWALHSGKCKPYWTRTSAPDTLKTFIGLGLKGLADDARRLMAGERVMVDTDSFQNDLSTLTCKDDVLTLLVHLGYLTFEEVKKSCGDVPCDMVRIPNHEIRSEYARTLRGTCSAV